MNAAQLPIQQNLLPTRACRKPFFQNKSVCFGWKKVSSPQVGKCSGIPRVLPAVPGVFPAVPGVFPAVSRVVPGVFPYLFLGMAQVLARQAEKVWRLSRYPWYEISSTNFHRCYSLLQIHNSKIQNYFSNLPNSFCLWLEFRCFSTEIAISDLKSLISYFLLKTLTRCPSG